MVINMQPWGRLSAEDAAILRPSLPEVVTATVTHPSVKGSYGILCDNGRIIGSEGPEFDGSEKGLIKKLTIDFLDIWEKNEDGIWKTLSLKPLPSSQAIPLLAF